MRKRTIILAVILLVLLGVGGYYLYTKFGTGKAAPSPGVTAKEIETDLETQIFADSKFVELKQHIKLPIKVGEKGTINPFMKF